jgi:SRSO17 transposase
MSLLEHEEAKLLLNDATLTASTVSGCRRRVTAFLERYLPCFGRRELRDHAVQVLRGKLSALNRKTCEPIAREAGVARKPVQTFVGAGVWNDEDVMSELRRHATEEFCDPNATLVVDGSAFPKKGTQSCGVQRQWCGRLGKVDNCQVGVFLACVSGGRAAPLDRTLYLPREWADDPVRRQQCHVPTTVCFAEKWQLALRQMKRSRDVPHGWIVADDEFGRVAAFRAKLRARKERYVLDVPCNTLVRVPAAPPGTPPKQNTSRKGATQQNTPQKRGQPRLPLWVRVDQWAAQQPAAAWQRIEVRPGEKGPLCVEVLHANVQTDTKQTGERLLVIRTVEAHPLTHYCLSSAKAHEPVENLVEAHDDRHRIEELFQLGNGEVGLDHYEVRSWVGWHHHITLSLLAIWFLVLERQRVGKKNTGDHGTPGARHLQPPAAISRPHFANHRRHHHDRTAT